MNDQSNDNRPLWWKASHVAPLLGMSVDVMLSSIAAGQLPIRVDQFGNRGLIFVNSSDVVAYIDSQKARPPQYIFDEEEMSEDAPGVAGWWRLAAVASMLRVNALKLRADCEAKRVPIRVALLGRGARPYLNAKDVTAYLATLTAEAAA